MPSPVRRIALARSGGHERTAAGTVIRLATLRLRVRAVVERRR